MGHDLDGASIVAFYSMYCTRDPRVTHKGQAREHNSDRIHPTYKALSWYKCRVCARQGRASKRGSNTIGITYNVLRREGQATLNL